LVIHINIAAEIMTQRLSYVLDFMSHYPFLEEALSFTLESNEKNDLTINYGGNSAQGSVFIPAREKFFRATEVNMSDLVMNAYQWGQGEVYSVEHVEDENSGLFYNNNRFGFDLFEAVFFHLSRYEEYHASDEQLDEMDRIPESELIIKKFGLEQEPVVDQLLKAFFEAIKIPVKHSKSAFVLTHDIDKIHKYNNFTDGLKAFFWPIVNRFSVREGIRNIWTYFGVRNGKINDPYDTYSYLFRHSKVWKEKIIFFMAGGKTRYDLYDEHYLRDFDQVYSAASVKGYRSGIHPSFLSFRDEQTLKAEKQKLAQISGEEIIFNRQHFLHFDFRLTPRIIENVGLKYDSSIGFTRSIGFRSGTGFEHRLYDFEREKPYDFIEMPLVVMDSSLVHHTKDDMDLFKTVLFSFVQKNSHGTCIVFNFHNSTFDFTLGNRQKLDRIYDELEAFLESL
jgi:hypothetical protein